MVDFNKLRNDISTIRKQEKRKANFNVQQTV